MWRKDLNKTFTLDFAGYLIMSGRELQEARFNNFLHERRKGCIGVDAEFSLQFPDLVILSAAGLAMYSDFHTVSNGLSSATTAAAAAQRRKPSAPADGSPLEGR